MMGFHQDMPKNEIRILIDRIPNTLDSSQAPDTMAQRIVPLISELHYSVEKPTKNEDFTLDPTDPALPKLHFVFVRDELTRAMLFMSGRGDVLFDTLSLTKTDWMKKKGFQTLESPGFTFQFVGFQLKDPILKNFKVRQAIQLAFPVSEWMHYKLFDWVEALPETHLTPDLAEANRLLDEAKFPRDLKGIRFSLQYFTTPVREGNEMAFLVREALKNLGIQITIQPLETSLFYSRLKKGDFQIFSGRIIRNSEKDLVSDFLSPKGIRNYFSYDALPDHPFTWNEVKSQVFRELPIIPLYTWKHAAVFSARVSPLPETAAHLDDSFRFLNSLRLK
jgi:ABC-type transport system substrate-binding protein